MVKKLWLNAFLISPIAALYGAFPFFFLQHRSWDSFAMAFVVITTAMLVLWATHIYFAIKFPYLSKIWKYIIAYAGVGILRLLLQSLVPYKSVFKYEMEPGFEIYNAFVSLLPNAIIMVLCNNIVSDYKRAEAETEIQELRLQNSEAQKLILKQQLQPHFLFNALGVLKSLISTDQQKAEEYTIRLSHFLQYSIHSHKTEIVDLGKEVEFVKDYIALQKVRFGNAFIAMIDIPEQAYNRPIPIFSIQTLVENIFKHNHFTEKKPLEFSIVYQKESLLISNKKNPATGVIRNNTGLTNLNSRYKLIANKEIEISQTPTVFTVKIPIL